MRIVLSYLLTPVYLLIFGLLLLIFHPLQFIGYHLGGEKGHKVVVDMLNGALMLFLLILGVRFKFNGFTGLPEHKPLIIVANHQSAFDVPPIVWGFRRYSLKFVAKKELAKNIPSISYNLRKSGAALIDRKKPALAVKAIENLGEEMCKKAFSVCIFPEGTRSRTGRVKKFASAGLEALLKNCPEAILVPLAIDGSAALQEKGFFPLRAGTKISITALEPLAPQGATAAELAQKVRSKISDAIR